MVFSEMLTYSSILFTMVLMLVYLNKPVFKSNRTKLYRVIIIASTLFTITEIIPVLSLKYLNSEVLVFITWRIHWLFAIVWIGFFYFYCNVIIKEIQTQNLLKIFTYDRENKIATCVFVSFALIYFFVMPFSGLNTIDNIDYLPGLTAVAGASFAIGTFIVILIDINKNKGNVNKNEKITMYIAMSILFLAIVIQAFFVHISILPLGFTLFTYSIYFNIENPDLKLIEETELTKAEIDRLNMTKTDFLSNMSVEIKVPMELITNLCEELDTLAVDDEKLIREDIEQIKASGNNLLDIINNVLDISKIESGYDKLQEKDYKINEIIENLSNIAKSKIGAKPIKLIMNVDKNISSVLYGDSTKLYQSLLNILTNAVKYTDVGRITFTLTSTKNVNSERLLFKISDTGTGIKDEDRDKVFSKFSRLDNALEGEIYGSGLGLAITKQYIESMNGKIWYDTTYRVGTTFYIELEQKIVDSTTIGQSVETEAQETNAKLDCSNYKVLVVDDNTLNLKVAKRILEEYKFQVNTVTNGNDCIYKVKNGEEYDIIFLDHMMPEIDGIETLNVLKKLDGYKLPPIVALTANAIAGMKEKYLEAGFDDYLSKPINRNELNRVVNRFFRKK